MTVWPRTRSNTMMQNNQHHVHQSIWVHKEMGKYTPLIFFLSLFNIFFFRFYIIHIFEALSWIIGIKNIIKMWFVRNVFVRLTMTTANKRHLLDFNLTITARVILQFVNKRLASCGLFLCFQHSPVIPDHVRPITRTIANNPPRKI